MFPPSAGGPTSTIDDLLGPPTGPPPTLRSPVLAPTPSQSHRSVRSPSLLPSLPLPPHSDSSLPRSQSSNAQESIRYNSDSRSQPVQSSPAVFQAPQHQQSGEAPSASPLPPKASESSNPASPTPLGVQPVVPIPNHSPHLPSPSHSKSELPATPDTNSRTTSAAKKRRATDDQDSPSQSSSGDDSDSSGNDGTSDSDGSSSVSSSDDEDDRSNDGPRRRGGNLTRSRKPEPKAKDRAKPPLKARGKAAAVKKKVASPRVPTRKVKSEVPPTIRRFKKEESSESSGSVGSEDDSSDDDTGKPVVTSRAGLRDAKTELIAQVLCRWWYVLPPWPPEDFDFAAALRERQLHQVSLEDWEAVDDVDENGFTKVYAVSHFPGVYRDPTGKAIDLRPLENKPCYSQFRNKTDVELYELLIQALKNQREGIKLSPYVNTERTHLEGIAKGLDDEIKRSEEALFKVKKRQEYLESRKQGS